MTTHFSELPESDHATQARQPNAAHKAERIDYALRALDYRHADPLYMSLQRELSRNIVVLGVLRELYDSQERETNCHDLHILSVIDEFTARVERAQLRVNRRSAELEGKVA